MALTTLDGILAGMKPPSAIYKIGATMEAIGLAHSHWYDTGFPGAGAAPGASLNGAALSAPLAGQLPFVNPPGGQNSYLAKWLLNATQPGSYWLCDRIWHNGNISATSTSLQSITHPGIGARDANGSTNGVDLLCGIEWSVAGGAGTPTYTLTYTNESGVGSHTTTLVSVATPNAGTFELFGLQAGDTGIRSIQGIQANATHTSGTLHLVQFRILAQIDVIAANIPGRADLLTGDFARLYNDTVPFIIQIPSATTATNLAGQFIYAQG
jgi:hypothetical protein